jgi:hypothetical protein
MCQPMAAPPADQIPEARRAEIIAALRERTAAEHAAIRAGMARAPTKAKKVTSRHGPTVTGRATCEGCGAALQHHLRTCAWCLRPHS